MLNNTKGFTLMEILVVVTIIGILAAIAVPSYIYAVEKGREDACDANVHILITQVERYRLEMGHNIAIGENESLVRFLEETGYLVGQEIQCPFYSDQSEGTKYEYKLTITADGRQTVYCTHDGTDEENDEGN
ncbi:MAG: type IV pilin protein [Bacillota bacterium]|jgi:prepilin-type N-terminal cleavage/methylation domain-containing protein